MDIITDFKILGAGFEGVVIQPSITAFNDKSLVGKIGVHRLLDNEYEEICKLPKNGPFKINDKIRVNILSIEQSDYIRQIAGEKLKRNLGTGFQLHELLLPYVPGECLETYINKFKHSIYENFDKKFEYNELLEYNNNKRQMNYSEWVGLFFGYCKLYRDLVRLEYLYHVENDDIGMHNIMWSTDGSMYIIDFGNPLNMNNQEEFDYEELEEKQKQGLELESHYSKCDLIQLSETEINNLSLVYNINGEIQSLLLKGLTIPAVKKFMKDNFILDLDDSEELYNKKIRREFFPVAEIKIRIYDLVSNILNDNFEFN